MTQQPQLDIHDYANDLTRTHTHRERYQVRQGLEVWTRDHITSVPALVLQLLEAQPASQGSDSGAPSYSSRPAARIEALDTIMLIDDAATRWLARLGADDPNERLDPRTGLPVASQRATTGAATIAVINKLHGLHASQDVKTQRAIEADMRSWWHQARIVSGWDSAAWRPDNTCPVCEQRRSLRINLTSKTGLCVDCRSLWTEDEIGLLADWIRLENAEDVPAEADTDDLGGDAA
jgi:hypothetical protein